MNISRVPDLRTGDLLVSRDNHHRSYYLPTGEKNGEHVCIQFMGEAPCLAMYIATLEVWNLNKLSTMYVVFNGEMICLMWADLLTKLD